MTTFQEKICTLKPWTKWRGVSLVFGGHWGPVLGSETCSPSKTSADLFVGKYPSFRVHQVQKPQDSGVSSSRGLQSFKKSVLAGASGLILIGLNPWGRFSSQCSSMEVGKGQVEYQDTATRGQHHQAVRGLKNPLESRRSVRWSSRVLCVLGFTLYNQPHQPWAVSLDTM